MRGGRVLVCSPRGSHGRPLPVERAAGRHAPHRDDARLLHTLDDRRGVNGVGDAEVV